MTEHQRKVRKERKHARKLVRSWLTIPVLIAAQNFKCPICEKHIDETHDLSIEHVNPLNRCGTNAGNVLMAHERCNRKKGDALPTDRALEMLDIANSCLGYDPDSPTGYMAAVKGNPKPSLTEYEVPFELFVEYVFTSVIGYVRMMFKKRV